MGASKEDTMSVRDRIHSVLHSFYAGEEDDDPPDATSSSGSGGGEVNVPRTSGSGEPTDTSPAGSDESSAGGEEEEGSSGKKGSFPLVSNEGIVSQKASDETSAIIEGAPSLLGRGDAARRIEEALQGEGGGVEPGNQYVLLRELLARQLRLIQSLEKRLSNAESNCEQVTQERDQLRETLNSERQQNVDLFAEIRNQSDAQLQEKNERILELEHEMSLIIARRPTHDKETCVTPLPPISSPVCNYLQKVDGVRVPVNSKDDSEDEFIGPPHPKRAKLDEFPRPSSSSSIEQREFCHFNSHQLPRRSDSPPNLSPAVTPKSTATLSSSGRPRGIQALLGEETLLVGPPDEFQDELEHINRRLCSQEPVNKGMRSFTGGETTPPNNSAQKRLFSSKFSSPPPVSSIFPNLTKPFSQFTLPENQEKNKGSSSNNNNSSFHPVKSHIQYPNNCQNLANRHRSNNFLNLNRPLPKKSPVVLVPASPSTPPSVSSSSLFRPLDDVTTDTPEATSTLSSPLSSSSSTPQSFQSSFNDSVPSTKKRPGRPVGSFKRVVNKKPHSPPGGSSGSSMTPGYQYANGLQEPTPPPAPPPQRFSRSGRLLKPNRARYSPEPEVSTREKYMTTKKGYFVGEPLFVQPNYSAEEHQDDYSPSCSSPVVLPLEDKNYLIESESSKPDTIHDENSSLPEASITAVVEVPKWRETDDFEPTSVEEIEYPEDDMSEEAYLKRHQKLEAKEKQRKRWDSQRMREESYLERLKRKQEERERQREFRRQQRKRNKTRNGANEEESVTPSVDEIKAIHIGADLPVGAFGHPLPLVEKVEFKLMWDVGQVAKPQPVPVVIASDDTVETNVESPALPSTESETDRDGSDGPEETMETESNSSTPTTIVSPSSSSSSSPVSSPRRSPGIEEETMIVEETGEEEISKTVVEDEENELVNADKNSNDDDYYRYSDDDRPSSPIYTVDLIDYAPSEPDPEPEVEERKEEERDNGVEVDVDVDDEEDSSDSDEEEEDDEDENPDDVEMEPDCEEPCDISVGSPSISIPLESVPSSPPSPNARQTSPITTGAPPAASAVTSLPSRSPKEPRSPPPAPPRNSTVVRFPQMLSLRTSTSASLSASSSTSSSATPQHAVSRTSITFFIPANPLAPKPQRAMTQSTPCTASTQPSSPTPAATATTTESNTSSTEPEELCNDS